MKIRRIDKVRIVLLLPLSLVLLVLGSFLLSNVGNDNNSTNITPGIDSNINFITTEISDLLAQAPEPPSPTPLPTSVPEPPSPTPIPTDIPALSCNSSFSYSGSGSNLSYVFKVDTRSANNQTTLTIDIRPYLANNNIQLVEYSGNCRPLSNDGLFACNQLSYPALIFFKVINEYQGNLDFKAEVEKSIPGGQTQGASCNSSINIQGINTPPSDLPPYSPQPSSPPSSSSSEECNPYAEYCAAGANLLDDIDFNQSHDGGFENPVCTLKIGNTLDGECGSLDRATYYEADISIQIPINSEPFFSLSKSRPEYVRQVVVGDICEEKLQSQGNHAFKIFSESPLNEGIDGGLCVPIKAHSSELYAGINFRTTQNKKTGDPTNENSNPDNFSPVTFKLGYYNGERPLSNVNIFNGATPPLTSDQIVWVDQETVGPEDYGGEGDAYRFAGGFLSGVFADDATALCFKSEASAGITISAFWDSAFAAKDENACEDALNHSDGIDRSCGGFECGNTEPVLAGNTYTDFTQEEYAFKMPANWNAKQCEYKTETNGGKSPYGTLFVGLDLNSCDPNYSDVTNREINPDFECAVARNWTYGYSWTGGIKDFGLLQYLDCSLKKIDDNGSILEEGNSLKGTSSSPFFCDSILKSYSNSKSTVGIEDPSFTIRYTNTYSGLVNAIQAEGQNNFWKVPLLGSAVANRIINNRQDESFILDPFLIGKRNSGSGMNNAQKFNLEDFVVSQVLRIEEHLFENSIIPRKEVLVSDLIANGPVCRNIEGDPITKIHYGSSSGVSDRAIFGFADDEGSFEHVIKEENLEIDPETLCDYQFLGDRVEGAECTILDIGDGKDVTFTEGNIGKTLESAGLIRRVASPTLAPPSPPGIPDPDFETCPTVNLCGKNLNCSSTMMELYTACRANSEYNFDEIGGDPFIRWEQPNGWKDLEISGLNKVLESGWQNEFIHYNQVVRHDNVGLDVNQVVSVYDQQQPKCSSVPGASYCTNNSTINKAAQVCRRVEPYNCDCQPSNYSTCLLACKQLFVKPQEVPTVGLKSEGTIVPTLAGNVTQPLDNAIRPILENTHISFLERFISILTKREGDYNAGEIYEYAPLYTGGFLLANTSGTNPSQCSSTNEGATGVSQVRIENYYAYGGQLARINERVGFAATNNKDAKTADQLIIDPAILSGYSDIGRFIRNGGFAYPYIALPYCDLLTDLERQSCGQNTNKSCDCIIRTCEQQKSDKTALMEKYLKQYCELMAEDPIDGRPVNVCMNTTRVAWTRQFNNEFDECELTPKNNQNFNCDPMANYLMDQGFDTPELRLAACDEIINNAQCSYDKFGVHLITGPTQEDKYARAENLGLKWKMEVITSDSEEMKDAMAQSINSFNGKSIFRFCNADQGDPGSKIQDQSCAFRTKFDDREITTAESGVKVARFIMDVARKTSKSFVVTPINEPISEHWYGGSPNDLNFTDTMPTVSEFYVAFMNELSTDETIKSRIEVGGPTFNVTAFNNFNNFTRMYNEFGPKELVDFWTVTMYNNNDLPEDIRVMENQFTKVKEIITSKPIALNETGDFQRDLTRLQTSYTALGSDPRLKYALLFNAFGGLGGDSRAEALILSDTEIKTVLSSGRECTGSEGNLMCIEGGIYGLIKAVADGLNAVAPQISAEAIYALGVHEGFGGGLSGDANEMTQTNPTLGNDLNGDGQISPPCATPSNAGCEYDVRGAMQFQNFTFHTIATRNYELMKNCTDSIGVNYEFKGPLDEGMLALFGGDMEEYDNFEFSRNRVGDNICAAAIFVSNLGETENGSLVTPEQWREAATSFVVDDGSNLIFRVAGRYLGVTDYDTCSKGGVHYEYCNQVTESMKATYERGTFDSISGEECTNFLGYSGTCEEIFDQVKQEDAYSAISATAKYSEEIIPFFEETFATLRNGSHMCSMNNYGTDNTLYCFEKGMGGEQVPLSVCQECPVRATALFRHELNHAVSPITAGLTMSDPAHRILNEFSAEAVSNNGGFYMFSYQGQWLFATQIVQRISTSQNIPVDTIHKYLNGKIPNPGIDFKAEVTGICHYNGGDAIGVSQCPTRQIPPGLEDSNCQNVGNPPSGDLPDPILLGLSTGGREINAYKFGFGPNKILFVGGMHGGYEWNSIVLAYEAIEYFAEHSEAVPNLATLYIIPSANPDGQARAGLGTGPITPGNYPRNIANRYNDNGVDLNRNFDCHWTPNPSDPSGSLLQGKGGTHPESEVESQILASFIRTHKPKASVFWHSAGNFISPAGCDELLYPPSIELSNTYGGYHVKTQEEIDESDNDSAFSYVITGDITNWMETEGYVGTTVELRSQNSSEFERNIPGMLKVLQKYGKSGPVPSGPQPI